MAYFLSKISYQKLNERGENKRVTESYLIDSLSFTECEARVTKEMEEFISGDFLVKDISRYNISDIIQNENESDNDKWYNVKLTYITLDDKSGKEKKTNQHILVKCFSSSDAIKLTHEYMKGSISDYEISAVVETDIMDVFLV